MKKKSITKYLRIAILTLTVVVITIAAYRHQSLGGGEAASIHALCPYGGLESLFSLFTAGTFIQKIFSGTLILFTATILLAILFRKSFCGILCPFGALQEFFHYLGKKLFKRRFEVPKQFDRPLRYLKYIVLIVTVMMAWKTAELWVAPYDPWAAYAHLSEGIGSVWEEAPIGLILLGVTLVGSLLYDRFFCKYLCPMGAFYSIIGKFSPYKVVRNEEDCIQCGLCTKSCPMNIDVQNDKEIQDLECINCQKCVMICPKQEVLQSKFVAKSLKPGLAMVLILSLFFVPIAAAKGIGYFEIVPASLKVGEILEMSEVKGYMTIQKAMEDTHSTKEEFYKAFQIPKDIPKTTKMKELKDRIPGYEFDAIKESLKK